MNADHPGRDDRLDCPKCGQVHPRGCIAHISSGERKGQPCGNYALKGQRVCRYHGGASPGALVSAPRLGRSIETTAADALISGVCEAAGNVEFYRGLVERLGPAEILASGSPTGRIEPHVWVRLYNEERDRLANFSDVAHKAGIEEHKLRWVEEDARTIFGAMYRAMTKAGLTTQVQELIRQEMRAELASPEVAAWSSR